MIAKLRSLKNHAGFMKYFKNTSWLFAEKVLRMIAGFFIGVWVARYLGPEQYGLFSYAMSFAGMFTVIATLGLDGIVVRELVKDDARTDELLGTAFGLKFAGAFLVLSVLYIAIHFTSSDANTKILVFIIASAVLLKSFNVIDMYFQSRVLSKYVVYANTISLFISSLIKVFLILDEASLAAFAWVVLFDSFVQACGLVYFFRYRDLSPSSWTFNAKTAFHLLRDSWPLILVTLSATVYSKIDQVMIKEMIDALHVGLYSSAINIYSVLVAFSPILAFSLQAALINAHQRSQALFESRLVHLYALAIWSVLAVSAVISIYSEQIVSLVYGNGYAGAENVLQIYIFCAVFAFIGGISTRWFIINNLQKLMSYYMVLTAVLNIVLNFILIPVYGVAGASLASLVSFAISSTFANVLSKKTRPNFTLQVRAFLYPAMYVYRRSANNIDRR